MRDRRIKGSGGPGGPAASVPPPPARARYEEAEPLFERSLAICEKALGAEHPHTVQVRNNLSDFRAAQD